MRAVTHNRSPQRRGYALLVVLLVIAVLSLAAYRFADAMTAEYAVAIRATEAAQARAFAVSGIYYAAGALADPDTMSQLGDPADAGDAFAAIPVGLPEGGRGGGLFSVFSVADTFNGSGEGRYQVGFGATDESGKLNLNALIQLDPTGQVLYDALMKLPNMTEDVADAIVDWLDADDIQRPNGAESAYYTGLPNPYRAKNAPADTLDELLLVRGVTPALLYGNDRNRNGRLDPGESDGNDFNRGWSEFITVYGRELDVDTYGTPRIALNEAEVDPLLLSEELAAAVGQELSDYILFYRLGGSVSSVGGTGSGSSGSSSSASSSRSGTASPGTATAGTATRGTATAGTATRGTATTGTANRGGSSGSSGGGTSSSGSSGGTVAGTADDLRAAVQEMISAGTMPTKNLDTVFALYNTQATLPIPEGSPEGTPAKVVPSPLNDPTRLNDLLPQLLDTTTPRTGLEMVPRVNLNTAPPEVLAALPELTAEDVSAILAARGSVSAGDPAHTTGAWLLTAAKVPPTRFQAVEKYVTGRSMVYRVQSVGYFARGGPTARMEAVIDTNLGNPRIVYFRDLTDLGRGFDLPR